MRLFLMLHECEGLAELSMKLLGAVAHDRKAAAMGRTVFRKSGDDDMTARLDGTKDSLNIGVAILWGGEKMKDGSVVPYIESVGRKLLRCNVCFHPGDPISPRTKALPRGADRCRGKVEHGEIRIAPRKKVIHER